MRKSRDLPIREQVFIRSLLLQGFSFSLKRKGLKYRKGYVIPATKKEDAHGTDLFVKMPYSNDLLGVQIKQRGVKMFKRYKNPAVSNLETFQKVSNEKIANWRKWCWSCNTVFVLVSDFEGAYSNRDLSWRDVKALRHGVNLFLNNQ